MMVDYLSSQPDWAGYQVSTKKGSGPRDSARVIAQKINRHHSAVAREITRNGWKVFGEDGTEQLLYNAHNAAVSTAQRIVGPISARLEDAFNDDESMRIPDEALYSALHIQGKGSLRAELEGVMKTKDVLIRGRK